MTTTDLCKHDLDPRTCSVCLHGVSKPAPSVRPSYCSTCDQEIIWVVTEKGKRMPIDSEPGGEGARFRKERVDASGDKIVHFVKDSEMEANVAPLYQSHFASCPDRDLHRRSR